MVDWLRLRGATVHPALDLQGRRPDGVRGVVATQHISKGELLCKLPRSAVVTTCESRMCGWLPEAARSLPPVLRVALFLLRECAQGGDSEWAPYLQSLPTDFETLEFWEQDELEQLRGTCLYTEIARLTDAQGQLVGPARVMWDKSIAPIVLGAPELWPQANRSAFLRACAAVRTRGFFDSADGGSGPYLLPAIDLLNHARAHTATSLVIERGEGCGSGSGGELTFSMVAERDICAGEEVTHTYDDLDNTQLLLTYGFVASADEAPLAATARISIDVLVDACEAVRDADACRLPWDLGCLWATKRAVCERLLSIYDNEVAVSVKEPLPDVMLTIMQLMLMPADDFIELVASDEQHAAATSVSGDSVSESARMADFLDNGAESASGAISGRPPLLDASTLEDEPQFAALVADALLRALDEAMMRYPAATSASTEPRSAKRLRVATLLRAGELEALQASRRQALRLLCASHASHAVSDEEDEEDKESSNEEEPGCAGTKGADTCACAVNGCATERQREHVKTADPLSQRKHSEILRGSQGPV
eukprot:CAMPEP_0119357758 /NCGR_PEP_ID=MMETSP1334-20130426/6086_1 /TAXON_ID=127549 /ORGANISM="Calcidiscus leptoporus, Strain RCC1130" /LENGTH=539 /DNA_ID=CAMNT_0007372075 /DNA_START=81 /DNA_END=1700 /DNA_ORIENTATION=+